MGATLAQLLAKAKEAADLTNVSDYVTDATWIGWINDYIDELHRLVTNKFRATYYRTEDFTVADGSSSIALPDRFWRLKGLDIDADTQRRRAVLPFNFPERNDYRRDYTHAFGPVPFCSDRFYNVASRSLLLLQPKEHASGAYRLYYTPRATPLAEGIDRDFAIASGDTPPPSGSLDYGAWTLANGAFTADDVGGTLTLDFDSPNGGFSGAYTVLAVLSGTTVRVTPWFDPSSFSNPAAGTANVTSQPAGTANEIDDELDPYSKYIWSGAAIESLNKEESFVQIRRLEKGMDVIRADLAESLETDQGGPATIVDTDGDRG